MAAKWIWKVKEKEEKKMTSFLLGGLVTDNGGV